MTYVNPKDGSNALFDLRKGLHSVQTIAVKKLGIFVSKENIPATAKLVTFVRWGMRVEPFEKPKTGPHYFDWEIVSMFDTDSGLWLQNKCYLGLDC
jgi:hypothetical protein